jgi:PAS domain S-box-containing protein
MSTDERLLRKQNISTVLFSLGLIGCITILLLITYSSQQRIQDFALDQLRQDAEKRAGAVSYFYLERRNDLNSLAEQRTLSTYFENRALGMSMQYGLRDSLSAMAEQFGKLLDEKKLGGKRIFTRILFLDISGTILAERSVADAERADVATFLPSASCEATAADISLIGEGRDAQVVATIPYFFKGTCVGRIIAFIGSDVAYNYLLRPQTSSSKRTFAVTNGTGLLLYRVLDRVEGSPNAIQKHFPEMVPGSTYRYGESGLRGEIIALRIHIQDTPFYLVSIAPSDEILSRLTPVQLLCFMAVVCLLILGVMWLITRINTRKFVLQARLDEAAKSAKSLEEQNTLLQKEIGERLQAEESLRNSQELFSTFMSHLPAAVFIRDGEGRFLFTNRYCREVLGWKDVIGKSTSELFEKEQAERMAAYDVNALGKGTQVIDETMSNVFGDDRVFETHKFPVIIGDVTLLGAVSLDITERRLAEADKERLESRLRQAQKLEAVGTLAGGISHDFNNILSPIIGFTELALTGVPKNSPMAVNLGQVLKAAYRARDLVRQILSISRNSPEQQRIPVDFDALIKEALKFLRATLPTTIEIRQSIEKEVVLADPTQMHRVLMNLCMNAAHAMGERGVLDVRLSKVNLTRNDLSDLSVADLKPGPHLKLSISDNGCGMDAVTLERIFDPYFTTKEVGKGSGLGLAVVRGIVKQHEGVVTVESQAGKGTTFSIYIPAMEASVGEVIETTEGMPTGTERILLVDDERIIVDVGTAILEQLGYKVTPETDSLHALEVFRSRPGEFDLIITDYTMPTLTGTDLYREIRRIRSDMPIILCTGYSEKVMDEGALDPGVELLRKPFGMKQIAGLIRDIHNRRSAGSWAKLHLTAGP